MAYRPTSFAPALIEPLDRRLLLSAEMLVGSFLVPVNGSTVNTGLVLDSGVTYRLEAHGTMLIRPGSADSQPFHADAEFTRIETTHNDRTQDAASVDVGIGVNDNAPTGAKAVRWAPAAGYRSDHVYSIAYPGNSLPLKLNFHDSNHSDNANDGDLRVKVYRPVTLASLTVTDSDDETNKVTVPAAATSPGVINVFQKYRPAPLGGAGRYDARISLSGVFFPAVADPGSALWEISANGATPLRGTLADGNVNLDPTNYNGARDFHVRAGIDTDGDGVLGSTETIATADVYLVATEVVLNHTSEADDDMVRLSSSALGSDIPAYTPTVDAEIRLINGSHLPVDVPVTLSDPTGRLAFAAGVMPGATNPTTQPSLQLTLYKSGQSALIQVAGVGTSIAIGDAQLRVAGNGPGLAGGLAIGLKGMTVFWFNNVHVRARSRAPYAEQGKSNDPTRKQLTSIVGDAVTVEASAAINVIGLNPDSPQLRDLRIGIVQNVTTAYNILYKNPVIQWDDPAKNQAVVKDVTAQAPSQFLLKIATKKFLNDTAPDVAPLYQKPLPNIPATASSLAIPSNLRGGGTAIVADTPCTEADLKYPIPALTVAGAMVGTYTYTYDHAEIDDSFIDWCVMFDTTTGALIPLGQTTWSLMINGAKGVNPPQFPEEGVADQPVTTAPVLSTPYAPDEVANPANYSIESPQGTVLRQDTFVG